MPTRVTRLDEVGDRDAPVGSREWALYVIGRMRLAASDLDSDVVRLKSLVSDCEKHEAWKALGYASLGLLCQKEVGLSDDQIDAIKQARPGQSTGAVLKKVGAPKLKERNNPDSQKGSVGTFKRGNVAAYLVARLERDAAEDEEAAERLKRFESGGFRSVRQMAIDAGYVKEPTVLERLIRDWKKATNDERCAFLAYINK